MAKHSISEHGENETKNESVGDTSAGKTSRRNASQPINRAVRLRILQQAVYDYQAAGANVGIMPIMQKGKKATAIILYGVEPIPGDGIGISLTECQE